MADKGAAARKRRQHNDKVEGRKLEREQTVKGVRVPAQADSRDPPEIHRDRDWDTDEQAHRGGDDGGRRSRYPSIDLAMSSASEHGGQEERDEGRYQDQADDAGPGARMQARSRPTFRQLAEGHRERESRRRALGMRAPGPASSGWSWRS